MRRPSLTLIMRLMPISSMTPPAYHQQLKSKIALTLEEFAPLGIERIDVFASPESGYRMRAEFKAWHQGDSLVYAMYRPGAHKQAYTVDEFPQGSARMQQLMPSLLRVINNDEQLRRKLFQVEFLTSSIGDSVVTLVYHKPLCERWTQCATLLAEQIGSSIIGRSRGQRIVIGRDHVFEEFSVAGSRYRYQQIEGSFAQPNATVCASMLEWTAARLQDKSRDLLELYCGNGNFTLPLARNFRRVLATEVAKTSIHSAEFNCRLNGIENIDFVRMSSEEFTQAQAGVRPFRRLQAIPLEAFSFSTVFVDPPRAGLDEKTRALVSGFESIGYISCNPQTLKRDLLELVQTHRIERMALFDQFPYTEHRECGVILRRR